MPTESRDPDGFSRCPRDQSLFVLLYHYIESAYWFLMGKQDIAIYLYLIYIECDV